MGNAMHAMDTIDSMLGNAPDTINPDTISPTLGNDPPGMSFIPNGTGNMSSAGDMSAAKTPSGDFTVHLNGTFQPVTKGPDVGPNINLSDGTWSSINIYPVAGIGNNENHPIGTFYVQLAGAMQDSFCGYNIPGRGTMEMQFTNLTLTQTSDNHNGFYYTGSEDLNIVAATGAFAGYVGGHNHMVDQLHIPSPAFGLPTDSCFCNITPPT
jgi:hypothetical protein